MPGSVRSSTYRARPVTFARPSRRGMACPIAGSCGIRRSLSQRKKRSARSEPLFVPETETGTIACLVVLADTELGGVAGICLFQLALTFEVPLIALLFVFLACLASLGEAAFVAALVGVC